MSKNTFADGIKNAELVVLDHRLDTLRPLYSHNVPLRSRSGLT